MKEIFEAIKAMLLPATETQAEIMGAGAMVGASLSMCLGGLDNALVALFNLAVIDYFSGMAAACKERRLCSAAGFRGIVKKTLMFVVIAFAHLVDQGMGMHLLRDTCIMAYSANEGLSVIENAGRMGFGKYIPPFLKEKIQQVNAEKVDKTKAGGLTRELSGKRN